MTQAYFIVPGLLVPNRNAWKAISSEAIACVEKLTQGAEDWTEQTLAGPHQTGSAHLIWCWRVLTRSREAMATAPYRWVTQGGPRLSGQIWRLSLLHCDKNGDVLGKAPLTEAQQNRVYSTLYPLFQKDGFTLQRWDADFYLSRKTPWPVSVREVETLLGHAIPNEQGFFSDKAENVTKALALLDTLTQAIQRLGIADLERLWIDGGGSIQDFYPPTQIRSVLSDDTAVLGWADSAGILNHRVGKITGALSWPSDAPRGAVLALFPNLYKAWIQCNWAEWNCALPKLAEQLITLKEAARLRGCDEALIVACGEKMTKTFAVKLTNPKSILSRFRPQKSPDVNAWIIEEVLGR
ncbi:MAG: hypothetical protein PUK32_02190 [Sutterella sp.]|nr:hypothetical protein [Sutterella sp.]MDD7427130.1 hypothetical protein [Sutterella sp.]MDY3273670.1 hypothetical protein [Duodenibacillus sp.]